MNIRRIINEEISKYFKNELFENDGIRKNAIKTKDGHRVDFNDKKEREENPSLTNGDAEGIAQKLNNDVINVAAVAREMYPNLTPEGAQSKLRKKIKHVKNDSGTPYKLKKKEATIARRIIDKQV